MQSARSHHPARGLDGPPRDRSCCVELAGEPRVFPLTGKIRPGTRGFRQWPVRCDPYTAARPPRISGDQPVDHRIRARRNGRFSATGARSATGSAPAGPKVTNRAGPPGGPRGFAVGRRVADEDGALDRARRPAPRFEEGRRVSGLRHRKRIGDPTSGREFRPVMPSRPTAPAPAPLACGCRFATAMALAFNRNNPSTRRG